MQQNRLIAILAFMVLNIFFSNAQPWVSWEDSASQNFYKIQSSFNAYWANKKIGRSKGWKQFKRWEWYWQNRVFEDGSFPNAGLALEQFNLYKKNKNKGNRSVLANWRSEGPDFTLGGYAGNGRINSIAFDPTNTNIIYAGAAGGGLWKSVNNGVSWTTTTDGLASIGVSGIAVHPTNPNIVYIATGDGDGSDNYSVGVLKSVDGGTTFNTTGLNWSTSNNRVIRRIIMDKDNPEILVAATSNGIYRTTNGAATWNQVQTGDFFDVEAKPGTGATVYYASRSTQIYRSTDDGLSWTLAYTISGSNRISLAVTDANPAYLYVLSSLSSDSGFKGVYRSSDSGVNFSLRSSTPNLLGWQATGSDAGGQGWYDLALTADPSNAETVYVGGVNTWKSINGGTSWELRSHWYGDGGVQSVHADKHVFEWQGSNLWEGNDGGLYKSPNGGVKWEHKTNGMAISMMYRLAVGQTSPVVLTGLQDNGTKLKGTNGKWSDKIGGDGMDCAINKTNSNIMYGELYFGDIQRSTNGGQSWTNIYSNIPGAPSGAWVTPFQLVPSDNTSIIAAYDAVFKSADQGTTWTQIGSTAQIGVDVKTLLAVAPSNASVIYTGTSGALWRTIDGGTTWNSLSVPGSGMTSLAIHPTDPNTLWVVRSNYTAGQKVFKSTNGGSTWVNVSGTLPNLPVNAVVYQNSTSNGLYIGMDIGVYYKDDSMSDWELFAEGLPNAEVTDLEIDYTNSYLFASTFGRGIWKTELRNTVPSCFYPIHVTEKNITNTSIRFEWDVNGSSFTGFEYALNATSTPPSSGTVTPNMYAVITNLNGNSNYYFHVRTVCSAATSQWVTIGPIGTPGGCAQNFYDTGGSGSNYSNEESKVWTICPSGNCNAVKVTFSGFNVESGWDALYVFNGSDLTAPMISSANGITDGGFPAGGYYGSVNPGPFTSTHPSGCLTFRFLSDESTTGSGWNAAVSCILKNPMVSNLNDSGNGSLREGISCTPAGSVITIDNALIGQFIDINSGSLIINKNLSIMQSPSSVINVRGDMTDPVFLINNGIQFNLKSINIYTGNGTNGRAIMNNGTLNLEDTQIFEKAVNLGTGSSIQNNGAINLSGNSKIIKI